MRRRIYLDGKPAWQDDGPARARPAGYGGQAIGSSLAPTVLTHAQRKARGTATEEAAKHRREREVSAEPGMGAVEAAWFALARAFTYTGPHDIEGAHGIERDEVIALLHRAATEPADELRLDEAVDAAIVDALARVYNEGRFDTSGHLAERKPSPYLAVALVCDEQLDKSGGLLGRVRDRADALRSEPVGPAAGEDA